MSSAAFGKSCSFGKSEEVNSSTNEDSSNYREALNLILDRCIPLLVLGRKNLSKPWLARLFRELYQPTFVFQDRMTKAYENEKQAMVRGQNRNTTS